MNLTHSEEKRDIFSCMQEWDEKMHLLHQNNAKSDFFHLKLGPVYSKPNQADHIMCQVLLWSSSDMIN